MKTPAGTDAEKAVQAVRNVRARETGSDLTPLTPRTSVTPLLRYDIFNIF